MKLLPALFVSVFASSAVVSACSTHAAPAASDACTSYFQAILDYADRCGLTLQSADRPALEARFATSCGHALSAPGASGDAAAVTACAAKLHGASCNDDSALACDPPAPGDLAIGAACGESAQCQSGYCALAVDANGGSTSCGTCAARAAIGAACTGDAGCVDGASCVSSNGADRRCAATPPLAKAGETCFDPSSSALTSCAAGLSCPIPRDGSASAPIVCAAPGDAGHACVSRLDCVGDLACVGGHCAARLADGAACDPVAEGCVAGDACDPTAKKCAKVVYVATGQTCDDVVRVCTRGSCDGAGQTTGSDGTVTFTAGACIDPLPDGAACGTGKATCDAFAACVGGKCAIPDPSACK